jgi:hypothetical protein
MVSINSLSGGKTSSYMAVHYPANYNIFALITIEDINCKPKDESIIKYVENKLNKEFIATAEDDKTLFSIMNLEQKIGKEIIFLNDMSFDQLIDKRKRLPNMMWRFCTIEMKLIPIFNWWKQNINEKVIMQIGYRYDEIERSYRFSNTMKSIIGKSKNGNRNVWGEIEWREGKFPLIEDKILHYKVKQWADNSGIEFPNDSNCVGCFWKPIQQLRKNWDDNPAKMQWFSNKEVNKKWKLETTYSSIKNYPIQSDFDFGTGSGCQAGGCTD